MLTVNFMEKRGTCSSKCMCLCVEDIVTVARLVFILFIKENSRVLRDLELRDS